MVWTHTIWKVFEIWVTKMLATMSSEAAGTRRTSPPGNSCLGTAVARGCHICIFTQIAKIFLLRLVEIINQLWPMVWTHTIWKVFEIWVTKMLETMSSAARMPKSDLISWQLPVTPIAWQILLLTWTIQALLYFIWGKHYCCVAKLRYKWKSGYD